MRRRNFKNLNRSLNNLTRILGARFHYKRQLNRIICVLAILVLLLLIKRLNTKISSNIIQIVDRSIHYRVNIREDGKAMVNFSKKLLKYPKKTLEVLNIGNNPHYIPPIDGAVYTPFGEIKYIDGSTKFNTGVDIIPKEDKEAVAIDKGVVIGIEARGSKGYYISVQHENIISVYGYLVNTYVEEGDSIKQGDKIGTLGTNKDGNKYLRFEIWENGQAVNPLKYVKLNKSL